MIEVYISDILIDLKANQALQITLTRNDFQDFSKRTVGYTNKFKVPNTKKNRIAFDLGSDLRTTRPSGKTCRILQRGMPLYTNAIAFFRSVKDNELEFEVYEQDITYWDVIKDKTLFDLPGGIISISPAGKEGRRFIGLNWDVAFPLIDWGNLSSLAFFLPVYSYQNLVKLALQFDGYTVDSGSTYILDYLYRLGIPYSLSKFEYQDGIQNLFQRRFNATAFVRTTTGEIAYTGFDVESGAIYLETSPLPFFQGSPGRFTIASTGSGLYYSGRLFFDSTNDVVFGCVFRYQLIRLRGGVETVLDQAEFTGPSTIPAFGASAVLTFENQLLVTGDSIYLKFVIVSGTVNSTSCVVRDHTLRAEKKIGNDSFYYKYALPNIKLTDLLRDFAVRFGVLFKIVDKTIFMRTLNDVLTDRAGALDWTQKFVSESELNIDINLKKNNYYQYRNSAENQNIGRGNLEVNEIESDRVMFTSIFSETVDRSNIATYNMYDSTSVDIYDVKNKIPESLITIYPRVNGSKGFIWNTVEQTNYDVGVFDSPDYSTSFKFFIDTYYSILKNALPSSKLVERYYNLTPLDIEFYDPFKMVFDNGNYFLINKISYTPGQLAKVELLKV